MSDSCSYHSTREALWHCQPCRKDYCGECIPGAATNYHKSSPECILCNKPLRYVGASNLAKPFWQMSAFYFRYGLTPGPLTVIGLAAAASLLLSGMGILALVLLVATIALLTRYNLLVIETLAEGQLTAPDFGDALDGKSAGMFARVIGMIVVAGAVGYQFMRMGEGAFTVYSIALSLLTPAAMIVLALQSSLRAAINPLKLLQFTLIIGWPYWLLWLATSAVSAAPGYLLVAVAEKLPAWALLPLIVASTSYFYIVTSAMMGYLCLTKQQQLGITPQLDESDYLDEREFVRNKALADALILQRENRHGDARQTLVNALRQHPDDLPLNERYYRLLLATQDNKALAELGPHLLERFINLQQPHKAAELYVASKPAPAVEKPHLRHQLAEALYRQRKFQAAAALLNNLHKSNPQYSQLDAAYLLLAQIYLDGFNRDDTARKLLTFIRRQFPASTLINQVETLENILDAEKVAPA